LTSKEERETVQGETVDGGKGQKLEMRGAATAGRVGDGREREVLKVIPFTYINYRIGF